MPKIIIRQTIPTGATVENSDATYTDTVASGGTLVLPDSDVNVNGSLEGSVVSVKDVDINVTDGVNPVTPDAVSVVGNTVTIEVPAGVCVDWDAENFITATGITDATQQGAIRTLVTDLKDAGLWNKLQSIYPFVGGTATTHKFNLRNAQDSNGAFRLIFSGGWTHAATGALPNGTNGYADTFWRPQQLIGLSNFHVMVNVRNINTGATRVHVGCSGVFPGAFVGLGRVATGTIDIGCVAGQASEYSPSISIPPFVGSKIITTNGNRNARYFANGGFQTNEVAQTQASPAFNIFIGAVNNAGTPSFYDNCEFSFATIGLGLSDAEALDLHDIQLAFNTTLGR